MPIVDPSLLLRLSGLRSSNKGDKQFFYHYLRVASKNLYRNLDSIKSSIQFKKDLGCNISFVNEHFGCKFYLEKDIHNPAIKDYYKYFYDNISTKYRITMSGRYYYYPNLDIKLYRPNTEYYEHSWFFSSSNVIILCVYFYYMQNDIDSLLSLIILESDLMLASGYSIVLCVHCEISCLESEENIKIIDFMKTHTFLEIHFIIDFNRSSKKENLESFLKLLLSNIDDINTFFYLYSKYFHKFSPNSRYILKVLKEKPLFYNVSLSTPFERSFISTPLCNINQFAYCKTGFESDKIFISLSNIPIYSTADENDFTPIYNSGVCKAYMNIKDFSNWNQNRVPIFIKKDNNYTIKYANFEDIHIIKPDLYIRETLYLTKTNEKTIKSINDILAKSKKKINKSNDFKKEKIFSLFQNEKKIQKILIYVSYAYSKYITTKNSDFNMHKNQLFTALEACKICYQKIKDPKQKKGGVIYQVETGEGKSCIICLIASLLALMKKTVHITSSNIPLANRDYHESYEFFQRIGLTSAVLLHSNELPPGLKASTATKKEADQMEFNYNPNFYPDKYYGKKLFKNSSNMNFAVCGINNNNEKVKDKVDIVYSTFVNFESLYLRMMEMYPGYVDTYFQNCSLVIDEADSILIDELTNGTILSRSLQSNGSEILEFVYKSYVYDKKSANDIYTNVKEKYPECRDLKLFHIDDMLSQIDLVNQPEFTDGKKYSIETIIEKEKISIKNVIEKSIEVSKNITKKVESGIKGLFSKKKKKKEDENNKKSNNNYHGRKTVIKKQIVPFDYDHKGVLEPNKEFSGFVQQFIGIKEKLNNKDNSNMIIKEISMNYLYVSHPIFVNLYSGVCGLTGTIGNKYDKKILKEQYELRTKKIPRELPKLMNEYPVLLCDNIEERNNKIVSEIIEFNKKQYPVLVIFQDLNEITDVFKILYLNGFKNIYIFDGKDDKMKPDYISGSKGAISLGTNVCGRGTDIKKPSNPLHVIVTYFTSNSRVIYQAFGRTARQGSEGSVRIICLKEQFFTPVGIYNEQDMKGILGNFKLKNNLQRSFIERFKDKRKWIFNGGIKTQKLNEEDINTLRETQININRIKVFKFKFPICLSIPTFLMIQAQKIFSLYNCPNCKYTWMLFQKYIREMILESWSLFIEQSEKEYYKLDEKDKTDYKEYMTDKAERLYGWLKVYLPEDEAKLEIVPTFMHIHNIIRNRYEKRILDMFPNELTNYLPNNFGKRQFCMFSFGFKPYSLLNNSGARINSINGNDQKQTFIIDPELKYYKKNPDNSYNVLSITEKIDGIFNLICQKINDVIGSYIGLKFFLRRTLGGCEFGICYDFQISFKDNDLLLDKICLVDKDPLFLFTISVKSMVPIIAGILIIGLVYIASIAKSIFEWITNSVGKGVTTIIKYTIKEIATKIADKQIDHLFSKLFGFIHKLIDAQVVKLKKINLKLSELFNLLLTIVDNNDFGEIENQFNQNFGEKINMNFNFTDSFIENAIPVKHFMKIGFMLLLCLAAFLFNFFFSKKQSIEYDNKKVSAEFDESQNTTAALNENEHFVPIENINDEEKYIFRNSDK